MQEEELIRLQLTTLFTVVFVLIVTTVVRRLALYKAQEGATIAKLEQLQASISLPGTLRAAWSLRCFKSRTSVVLLLIWTFYYLGSQATTSEYGYRLSSASHKLPMVYFNVKKPSMFYSSYSTVKVTELALSNINAIYNTFTMVLSNANIPTASDLNGAVLLPLLRADGTPRFGQPRLQRGLHDYYDVSDPSKVIYTSYVGMPIFTLLPGEYGIWSINGMQGNYNLNASYFNASCEVMGIQNASSFPRNTDPQTQISINTTSHADPKILRPEDAPAQFDIWARFNSTSPVMYASCRLQEIGVQLKVSCNAGDCAAKGMRFQQGAAPLNRTVFDYSNFTSVFFHNLLYSDGIPSGVKNANFNNGASSTASQIIESFGALALDISSPADSFPPGSQQEQNAILAEDITQMINTYYQASLDPYQGSYNDPAYLALAYTIDGVTSPDWAHSTFEGNEYEPKYVLSVPWVVVDLISCFILLAAAVFAFWLRRRTLAPDIFGYVSSLTRDNPHLHLPDGGSTMSGLERARMLKHVRIKLADVANDSGVGKVGLSYAGPSDAQVHMAHLKRDRQYV